MTDRLAIDGGTPVRTRPMPAWPSPGDAEIAAVERVLRTGKLNYWPGSEGRALESEYAQSLGRAHGITLANGTVALELGLRAFGVGTGDEVIVPARTFIATASAVVAVGGRPVVADIDPVSNNLTADTVRAVLTPATRAVIPVHLGGWPVDMTPLLSLAEEHGLIVIEDCAQAHGAGYRGRPAGNLGSHAAAFSFCQDKIIPAGEGGLLVLDDDEAYHRAWSYKDHGKSFDRAFDPGTAPGCCFNWLHDSFGTNWRLDEMAAALVRVGLNSLPEWHAARTRNAHALARGLQDTRGLGIPLPAEDTEHGFYRLYGSVDLTGLGPGWDRNRVLAALAAEGAQVNYGTCAEIYRERAFVEAGLQPPHRLPNAKLADETSLAFFVHPTLSGEDIDDTIAAVNKVMEAATR